MSLVKLFIHHIIALTISENARKALLGIISFMKSAITNYNEFDISSENRIKLDEPINTFLLDN